MTFPDLQPITPLSAAKTPPAPRSAPAPVSIRRLIPAAEWRRHVAENTGQPALFQTLPDGTPLHLTPAGVQFIEQINGTMAWPSNYAEASLLLWAAALTPEEEESMWFPQPPASADDESTLVIPRIASRELTSRFLNWQKAILPPAASVSVDVQHIACRLWQFYNETALEIDEAGLPEETLDDVEKKNPGPIYTGLSPASTFSVLIPLAGRDSYSTPPGEPSLPPTEPLSPPPASPLSPLPTVPGGQNSPPAGYDL